MIELTTPLNEESINQLIVGDVVLEVIVNLAILVVSLLCYSFCTLIPELAGLSKSPV